jgi:TPR repeat protein
MRVSAVAALLFVSHHLVHAATNDGAELSAPLVASSAGLYTPPYEPDYEEEKIRFQRGTEPYYGLAHYSLEAVNARDTQQLARVRQAALRAANNGDAQAQYQLGVDHARGLGVTQDYVQARQWLSQAAAQNHAAAQVFLGVMNEQGRGGAQDYAQARRWYEKAAAQQSADAQFMLGLIYFQGKGVPPDDAQARQWFLQAAQRQSPQAQVNLGWMSEYGRGGEKDDAGAREWYLKAAQQDDTLAQYDMGTLYYQGKGVPQDQAQARYWLLKAAEKNDPAAQYSLGVMALGQESARDAVAAYQWFTLVKLAFYPGANQSIDKVKAELTPAQIAQGDAWVRNWVATHQVR